MELSISTLRALGFYGSREPGWAGDVSDRKSTSEYVFMINGAAVSCCSPKRTITVTSSCEAEYVALSAACKEAMWQKTLPSGLSMEESGAHEVNLLSDSQSAIMLSANASINLRNKYIDNTCHYVCDVTNNGEIGLKYVPTSEMVADTLMEPLAQIKLEQLRNPPGLMEVK